MGVNQSFIESVELSNGVEVTIQVNDRRVFLSLDGNPTSVQLNLEQNDLPKIIPILELALAYIKGSR